MDDIVISTDTHKTQITKEQIEGIVSMFKDTTHCRHTFPMRSSHNTQSLEIDLYSTKRHIAFEYEDAGQHYSGQGIDKPGPTKTQVRYIRDTSNCAEICDTMFY